VFEVDPDIPGQIEEKVRALVAQLSPVAGRIAALRPQCEVELVVLLSAWGSETPAAMIELPGATMSQISAMGASLNLSVYTGGHS